MPLAIRHVSREASLGGDQFPLRVRREHHTTVTERIRHDVAKLILLSHGTTTLTHDSGTLAIPEGDAVLLPPGHWYSGEPAGHVVTTTAYIDDGFLREHARWLDIGDEFALPATSHGSAPVTISLSQSGRAQAHSLMHAMLDGQRRTDPTFHRLSHAVHLIALLADQDREPAREHDLVQRAIVLLNEQLDAPWTISALAQACAISVSQLSRLFQQQLQTSPARYLRAQRAHRMADLLISTTDSIETIARHVGWTDPAHASRAFRSIHGVSPQHYRRTHGGATVTRLQP